MSPRTHGRLAGPFKGLMPYAEDDAPFFFGREHDRDNIIDNLMVSRLTVLYGASGVGKSSLLRAGVVHGLRRQAARNRSNTGNPELAVAVLDSWRDDPLASLRQRVGEAIDLALHSQARLPPSDWGLVRQLEMWTEQLDGELLLILDQFEEYFLYHPDAPRNVADDDAPRSLAAELPAVFEQAELRVNVLISIREDALDKLDRRFKASILSLFDNRLALDHLDTTAARAAIGGPLGEWNRRLGAGVRPVEIEDSLIDAVLEEVRVGRVRIGEAAGELSPVPSPPAIRNRIETPYLQLVLTRLWDEELAGDSRQLRRSTLEQLGGAASIVHSHLDRALDRLSIEEQAIAARLFFHLVTPGGSKIAHTEGDLVDLAQTTTAQVAPLLDHLAGPRARILRPVPPPARRPDERAFEIFHDVLAVAVLDWRQRFERARRRREEAEALEKKRREMVRSAGWTILILALVIMIAKGEVDGYYSKWRTDLNLAERTKQLEQTKQELEQTETQLDSARTEHRKAIEEQKRIGVKLNVAGQQLREITGQLSSLLAESESLRQTNQELEADQLATQNRLDAIRLATEAQRRIDPQVDEATRLAFAAVEIWPSPDTRATLLRVLESHPQLDRVLPLEEPPGSLATLAPGWVLVHSEPEEAPRDRETEGREPAIPQAVWVLDGPPPSHPPGIGIPLSGTDERLVVTGLRVEDRLGVLDQTLRPEIEDSLQSWLHLPPIEEGDGVPNHYLAFGIGPGCLLWWNLSQRRDERKRCLGDRGGVTALAFEPRAGVLAAGWGTGEILVWRPGNAEPQDLWLRQHLGPVDFLTFAAPGVLVSADRRSPSLRVWRLEHPDSPGVEVRPLGFDLATDNPISDLSTSQGGAALWAVNPSMLYRWLIDSAPSSALKVNLATDRAHVVVPGGVGSEPQAWVGDLDGKIHPGRAKGHDSPEVIALALDPRRQVLAAGFLSGGARLWQLVDGHFEGPGTPLVEEARQGLWLTFDPTGERLAVTVGPKTVRLFAREDGFRRPTQELEAPPEVDALADLVLTADGRYLVAARQQGGVVLWNLTDGTLAQALEGLAPTSRSRIAVDPGGLLAVGDAGHQVQLWDLASPGHPYLGRLEVDGGVTALAFLPRLAGPLEASHESAERWLAIGIEVETGTGLQGRVLLRELSGLLDPNAWRSRVCRRAQRDLPPGSCPVPGLPACHDLCSDLLAPHNPAVAEATGGSPP